MRKTGAEITMIELVVIPKIEEVKALLREGKLEKAKDIIAHDILGLIISYRDAQIDTYGNVPDNLKSAPQNIRMEEIIDAFEEVIQILFDESKSKLYYVTEHDLDYATSKIQGIIQAFRG